MDQLGLNNFTSWSTQELKDWIRDYSLTPFLQSPLNINTYLQAINELNNREIQQYESEVYTNARE